MAKNKLLAAVAILVSIAARGAAQTPASACQDVAGASVCAEGLIQLSRANARAAGSLQTESGRSLCGKVSALDGDQKKYDALWNMTAADWGRLNGADVVCLLSQAAYPGLFSVLETSSFFRTSWTPLLPADAVWRKLDASDVERIMLSRADAKKVSDAGFEAEKNQKLLTAWIDYGGRPLSDACHALSLVPSRWRVEVIWGMTAEAWGRGNGRDAACLLGQVDAPGPFTIVPDQVWRRMSSDDVQSVLKARNARTTDSMWEGEKEETNALILRAWAKANGVRPS